MFQRKRFGGSDSFGGSDLAEANCTTAAGAMKHTAASTSRRLTALATLHVKIPDPKSPPPRVFTESPATRSLTRSPRFPFEPSATSPTKPAGTATEPTVCIGCIGPSLHFAPHAMPRLSRETLSPANQTRCGEIQSRQCICTTSPCRPRRAS